MPQINRIFPHHRTTSAEPKDVESNARRDLGSLLIVDDNTAVLQRLLIYFARNWNVLTATNGQEALDYLRAFKPDAVISDYCMPVLDGLELARVVRRDHQLRGVPFFLVTGIEFDKSELWHLGVTKVVQKPVNLLQLDTDLRNIVCGRPSAPPLMLPPILPDDPEAQGTSRSWLPRW